jgi:hypothetical protein
MGRLGEAAIRFSILLSVWGRRITVRVLGDEAEVKVESIINSQGALFGFRQSDSLCRVVCFPSEKGGQIKIHPPLSAVLRET